MDPRARGEEKRSRRSRPRRKGLRRGPGPAEALPPRPREGTPPEQPRAVSQVLSATTTATTENRRADRERVERGFGLPEVGDAETVFLDRQLNVLAKGYERIVYGDHGPYLEFTREQIRWASFPTFRQKHAMAYYDEYWSADTKIMICAQRRPVTDRPNPPKYGKFSVCNNRPEGYADYLPDLHYMAPDPEVIIVHRPAHLPRPSEQFLVGAPLLEDVTTSAWRQRFEALTADRNALVAARDRAEDTAAELEAALAALKRAHAAAVEENSRLRACWERSEGGTGTGVLVELRETASGSESGASQGVIEGAPRRECA